MTTGTTRVGLAIAALCGAGLATGCTAHLFSGVPRPDRSRPAVRIETRGGVEYGVPTELGVLFLGRTAQDGPCRVHYFLGPDGNVDDGTIERAGGILYRANVDLAQQRVPLWSAPLSTDDELVAVRYGDGDVDRIDVRLAQSDAAAGDLLAPPGARLPVGTGIFVVPPDDAPDQRLQLAGLVAGEATLQRPDGRSERYVVFAGIARLAELLVEPARAVPTTRIRYRPDGLWVREPVPEPARADSDG
ncbi:MAG: hypothetical protein IPM29_11790 [Planctomycetes bacterium]|nr:hypothetical protein [Planctomycetota bacterium]